MKSHEVVDDYEHYRWQYCSAQPCSTGLLYWYFLLCDLPVKTWTRHPPSSLLAYLTMFTAHIKSRTGFSRIGSIRIMVLQGDVSLWMVSVGLELI